MILDITSAYSLLKTLKELAGVYRGSNVRFGVAQGVFVSPRSSLPIYARHVADALELAIDLCNRFAEGDCTIVMSRRIYVLPFVKLPTVLPRISVEQPHVPNYSARAYIEPVWRFSERGGGGAPGFLRLYTGEDWSIAYMLTRLGPSPR